MPATSPHTTAREHQSVSRQQSVAGGARATTPAVLRSAALALTVAGLTLPTVAAAETTRTPMHEALVAGLAAAAAAYGQLAGASLVRRTPRTWRRVGVHVLVAFGLAGIAGGWALATFRRGDAATAAAALWLAAWAIGMDVGWLARPAESGAGPEASSGRSVAPTRALRRVVIGYLLLFVLAGVAGAPHPAPPSRPRPGARQQVAQARRSPLPTNLWGIALLLYTGGSMLALASVRYSSLDRRILEGGRRATGFRGGTWVVAIAWLAAIGVGAGMVFWWLLGSGALATLAAVLERAGEPFGRLLWGALSRTATRNLEEPTVPPPHLRITPQTAPVGGSRPTPRDVSDLALLLQLVALAAIVLAVVLYRYRRSLPTVWRRANWTAWRQLLPFAGRLARLLRRSHAATWFSLPTRRHGRSRAIEGPDRRVFRSLGLSSRQRVLRAFRRMVRRAAQREVTRGGWETPHEFAGRLAGRYSEVETDIETIAAVYVEARYSRHEMDRSMAAHVEAGWRRVRRALSRHAGDPA